MQDFDISALTHPGKVREINEDSFYSCPDELLFGVFDGVGGGTDGELASKAAASSLQAFKKVLTASDTATLRDKFSKFFHHTDRAIQEIGQSIAPHKGIGTTATIGLLEPSKRNPQQPIASDRTLNLQPYKLHLCILGDSRAYLLREHSLVQLGLDQSWQNTQVREGLIPNEFEIEENCNAITSALGYGDPQLFDYYTTWVRRGDLLLLCSDGLHGYVPHSQIFDILKHHSSTSSQEMNRKLMEAANLRGGRDNITSLLVKIGAPSGIQVDRTSPPGDLKEADRIKWVFGSHNGYLSSPVHISKVNTCPVKPEFLCNSLGHFAYLHDTKRFREVLQLASSAGAELLF